MIHASRFLTASLPASLANLANLATDSISGDPTQAYIKTTFSAHTTCHGVNLYAASRAFRCHHWIGDW